VDFIEMTATRFLQEAFEADLVGIWHIDLAGAGSYCLAGSPVPPEAFHDYAVSRQVVGEVRRAGVLTPLQGPDAGTPASDGFCLAIPLAVDSSHVRLVAVGRRAREFSPDELFLASRLQPVLAGVWAAQSGVSPRQEAELSPVSQGGRGPRGRRADGAVYGGPGEAPFWLLDLIGPAG
jgi:hypothetical protein